jgi:ComF family protein
MLPAALKHLHGYLLDLIFPKSCLGCRQEGEWLCPDCLEKIKITGVKVCPICKQDSENCSVCHDCRDRSDLDGLWVLSDYEDRLVQGAIKAIKYDYICELSGCLGRLAEKYFAGLLLDQEKTFLLPVPLHRRRYLERGFNQSEIIARELSQVLRLPLAEPLLIRQKYLPAQAKLSRAERINNIKSAFIYNKKFSSVDKQTKLILVDDVYTTGATMQECAKILRNEGFKSVWGLVIARGN